MKIFVFTARGDYVGGAVGVVAPTAEAARECLIKYGKDRQARRGDPEPDPYFNENTVRPKEHPEPGEFVIWKLLHGIEIHDPEPPGVMFCEYYS